MRCKAGNKKFKHWNELNKTKAFLHTLSSTVNIDTVELIKYNTGYGSLQKTWVHPQVAINIARWISPEFDVMVSKWVNESNESTVIVPNNSIFDCNLTLNNGTAISVPMRKDGYINVTVLCKISGKRIDNWKRLKESKELLKAFKAIPHNRGIDILQASIGGNHTGTFAHPDIAIQIAQWCSPSFAIQVSQWIRELLLTGKVELGNEKTSGEFDDIFSQRIGIDMCTYREKSGLYFYGFEPKEEIECGWVNATEEGRKYFGFGVTSHPENRSTAYHADKDFKLVRMLRFYAYDTRADASKAEKRVKTMLKNLDIQIRYGKKRECFVATRQELLDGIKKHQNELCERYGDNTEDVAVNCSVVNIELEKYRIENKKEKDIENNKMFRYMLKNKEITFEQFKELVM
jgi:hypothetical protein